MLSCGRVCRKIPKHLTSLKVSPEWRRCMLNVVSRQVRSMTDGPPAAPHLWQHKSTFQFDAKINSCRIECQMATNLFSTSNSNRRKARARRSLWNPFQILGVKNPQMKGLAGRQLGVWQLLQMTNARHLSPVTLDTRTSSRQHPANILTPKAIS